MTRTLSDLLYAIRTLRRAPVFLGVAVASLALGIGANTAIFSLLDQVLLRALPVRQPGELIVIETPGAKRGRISSDDGGAGAFSYPMYKTLRDGQQSADLIARFSIPASISAAGQTERVSAELVSGNYFQTLDVRPAIGRVFTQEDDRTLKGHPVVVLSYGFWERRFAKSAGILNESILVNGHRMTVVGVAQAGFFGVQVGQRPDLFVPITMKALMTPNWDGMESWRDYWLNVLGRVKPGQSMQQTAAALQPVFAAALAADAEKMNLPADRKAKYLNQSIFVKEGGQGRRILQEEARTPLLAAMAMVALVLLIACANVANLLIARAAARQKEIAVRLAMGASRTDLIRQLLCESLVIAVLGGLVGLFVASWTLDGLFSLLPRGDSDTVLQPSLNPRVLAFSALLSIVTGLLFGFVPALRATRPNVAPVLKDQTGNVSAGTAQVRFRKLLVAGQMALTTVLLIGAGLFARSLLNLKNVHLGVQADRVLAFAIAPELNGYERERAQALYQRLEDALSALPGVQAIGITQVPVLTGSLDTSNFTVEGFVPGAEGEFNAQNLSGEGADMNFSEHFVSPKYFSSLGIPLIAGRDFTRADTLGRQKVCIINETLAKRHFAGRDPIGRRIGQGRGDKVKLDMEVIGVVADSKQRSVRAPTLRSIYFPYMQRESLGAMTLYVRTAQDPTSIAGAVRAEVARLDGNLPVFSVRPLSEVVEESTTAERLTTTLSIAFGALAALLAAIGTYGVMAYSVARRTREFGIRMALGARGSDVRGLVLKDVAVMAFAGMLFGIPAGYALGRAAESLLYGTKASDPLVFAGAAGSIVLVAFAAGYFPARRATRIDPMISLRYE